MHRVAKEAASALVGVVVSVAQAYRSTRDWLEARKEQPFRG